MTRPKDPDKILTATVSVCVSEQERGLIRRAAEIAEMTTSAWCYTRTMAALASAAAKKRTQDAADEIARLPASRGARAQRVSMVMRMADHDALGTHARSLRLTSHAFAQAALLMSAMRELEGTPAAVRQAVERMDKAERPRHVSIEVPTAMLETFTRDQLSGFVRDGMKSLGDHVFEGRGVHIQRILTKWSLHRTEETQTLVELSIDEVDARIAGGMVRMDPRAVVRGVAVRAAAKLEAS